MLPEEMLLSELQHCVRTYARCVHPTARAGRLIIMDEHGKKIIDMTVPPGDEPCPGSGVRTPPPRAPDPPASGWDFSGPGPKFDGEPVPVRGRQLDVLKVLAATDGPVPPAELRAAWGGYAAEESTVRWQVAELRKTLARAFPSFEGEPISATGDGYQLLIR